MFDPECEGPSAEDLDRFGGDTQRCPSCGEEIYHDAPFCSNCGTAVADEKGPGVKRWVVITSIVALLAFVVVYVI